MIAKSEAKHEKKPGLWSSLSGYDAAKDKETPKGNLFGSTLLGTAPSKNYINS